MKNIIGEGYDGRGYFIQVISNSNYGTYVHRFLSSQTVVKEDIPSEISEYSYLLSIGYKGTLHGIGITK